MPCGAGKTIVGMAAMVAIGRKTLIVTTNIAAVHQWMDELADKTDLLPESIGEYTGAEKTVRPVTIATYQILTWRPDKSSDFPHFDLFRREKWGLIIYDEVHLLPLPFSAWWPRSRPCGASASRPPWCARTAEKRTCSA